jgi:Fic family protein
MSKEIYNFTIELSWKDLEILRQVEKFEIHWSRFQQREKTSLNQLKTLATIQSIGSSTRIEGSKLSDKQVQTLLEKIDITQIEDRDSQEVVGYYNALDIITESPKELRLTESTVKNLHNVLLKICDKDDWHRGQYKQHSNAVQATFPDGSTQIIFKTTEPGFATDEEMKSLVNWMNTKDDINPIIKTAAFVYEFLSIHPFQDGNGRLSRLLTTLLLLQNGYDWVEYISFEHEIEKRKKKYYQALRNCQAKRPNEDITEWIEFFLESLRNLINKLNKKLEISESDLSPKQKNVYIFICNNPEAKISKISEGCQVPRATLKRIITSLLKKELIEKNGKGAGTNYRMKSGT